MSACWETVYDKIVSCPTLLSYNNIHNPSGRLAVPIRIRFRGHLFISLWVGDKFLRLVYDLDAACADKLPRSGFDRLGTLGGRAQDEHRLPERGRFFLHSSGIC